CAVLRASPRGECVCRRLRWRPPPARPPTTHRPAGRRRSRAQPPRPPPKGPWPAGGVAACAARPDRVRWRSRARCRTGREQGARQSCVLLQSQRRKATKRPRDTQPRGRWTDAEAIRNLLVRQLLHDAQLERFTLVLREGFEPPGESDAGREPFLNGCVALLRGQVGGKAEPAARPRLYSVPAGRLARDVAGDAEEPRKRGALGLVPEAPAREPCLRKRLRGQVGRRPLAATAEPGVHPL